MMRPFGSVSARVTVAGLLWFSGIEPAQNRMDAPVITNLKIEPSSAPRGSRLLVHIKIFDRQGRDDILPVLYLLREGRETIKTPVYDDGMHKDALPNDGFYTGVMTIPLTAGIGNHWFVGYVYDKGGLRSNMLIYELWVLGDQEQI